MISAIYLEAHTSLCLAADTAHTSGIWASQPNMDLPVDGAGLYCVAVEVVCDQDRQTAENKLTASILAGKVSLETSFM